MTTRSEAFLRVEQAKLYQVLLSQDLFEQGASDDEVVELVTEEIRAFAEARLESLLGMRSPSDALVIRRESAELPWSEEQIEALTALADKVLQTGAAQQQMMKPKSPSKPLMKKTVKQTEKPIQDNQDEVEIEIEAKPVGQGFVSNPERKKFPSQSMMNDMNAQEAGNNLNKSQGLGGAGSLLLQQLTK